MNELTKTETSELNLLERVIERGRQTFMEVGNALAKIRDARLYRSNHKTFEEYCQDRWNFSKTHANRLLIAAQVVERMTPIGVKDNLSPIGDKPELPLPIKESQARPLAALPPEKQRAAWQEAVATAPAGKVTAVHVAAVAARHQEPPKQEKRTCSLQVLQCQWKFFYIWKRAPLDTQRLFVAWLARKVGLTLANPRIIKIIKNKKGKK